MKKIFVITMVIGILCSSGIAMASSIEPGLGILPVAGEAEFNPIIPIPGQAYVDWIVFNPGAYNGTAFDDLVTNITGSDSLSQYLYVYQIEARGNPAMTDVEDLTIYFSTSMATGAGFLGGTDLDTWHNNGNFGNLATEGEDVGAPIRNVTFGPTMHTTNITWDFDGTLDSSEESTVLWLTSSYKPGYTLTGISDTTMTSGRVPAPTPEPASMALLSIGLLGIAGKAVRKKFMA